MARLNSSRLVEIGEVRGAFDDQCNCAPGIRSTSSSDEAGGVIASSSPQITNVGDPDGRRAFALVGKPDGASADAIGVGIDRRHRLDHLGAERRIFDDHQRPDARFGETAHVLAGGDRAVVNRLALRVNGEAVGDDQRCAPLGQRGVHGDRDNSAERQSADVCFAQCPSASIAARTAAAKSSRVASLTQLALAVARIVERDRLRGSCRNARAAAARPICRTRLRGEK